MHVPLRISCPCILLLGRAGVRLAAVFQARHLADKDFSDIELPPEPTTCCMSGCANCVWVEYAQTVAKLLGDNEERAREIVLARIKDPNLKAFLTMELYHLKLKKDSSKAAPPEEPKKS